MPSAIPTKTKVAVLGGGVSALAAAFELSNPRHNSRYDITVYQLGWRLGGKCASGRDLDTDLRIKEHGPHLFFGFYDNAFSILREAYDVLSDDASRPFRTVEDALVPLSALAVMENVGGNWEPWVLNMPVMPGKPGTSAPPTLADALHALVHWISRRLPEFEVAALIEDCAHAQRCAGIALQGAFEFKSLVAFDADVPALDAALRDLRATMKLQRHELASLSDTLRRLFIMFDLGLAVAIGALSDQLVPATRANIKKVNELDFRDWLRKHGAAETTVNSALVLGLYDTVFAYRNGDNTKPGNLEAGSTFLAMAMLVGYRGAPVWKMRAGTGDVTAAPLYEVLRRRGVKVEFFHRVDKLVSSDGHTIDKLLLGRQVNLMSSAYEPLVDCKGLKAWPDRPNYEQIVEGAELSAQKIDLESWWTPWQDAAPPLELSRANGDFDVVVCGIPIAGLDTILPVERPQPVKDMLANVASVQTQNVQLWLDVSTRAAGFTALADPTVTSFDGTALDTWLDASAVLAWENWSGAAPAQMAILCGAMNTPPQLPPRSDSGVPAAADALVRDAGLQFVDASSAMWPRLSGAAGFDWAALRAPAGHTGAARFLDQYSAAAVNPSDRYTLSLAGTGKYRLAANDSGWSNLFFCGDWTDFGLNLGFFEGAIVSGLKAANAVSGDPRPILRDPFPE